MLEVAYGKHNKIVKYTFNKQGNYKMKKEVKSGEPPRDKRHARDTG